VTYAIVWEPGVVDVAVRFLADDPDGLRTVFDAVDALAGDPRPSEAFALGTTGLHRLRIGRYRVVYELDETTATIKIRHVGRRI
jgi:mRNA interferase RelE/StbE